MLVWRKNSDTTLSVVTGDMSYKRMANLRFACNVLSVGDNPRRVRYDANKSRSDDVMVRVDAIIQVNLR